MTNPAPQLLSISDWAGLDESSDDASIVPPKMRKADNLVFPAAGVIAKRNGFTAISMLTDTGVTITDAIGMGNARGELAVFDRTNVYGYSPTSQRHVRRGKYGCCIASRAAIATGTARMVTQEAATSAYEGQLRSDDSADAGGYRVITWSVWANATRGGGVYATVIDIATGVPISSAFLMNNTQSVAGAGGICDILVRAVGTGTHVVVVYAVRNNVAGGIFARSFDTITRTWTAEVALLAGQVAASPCRFDITPNVGAADVFQIAWNDQTGARIQVSKWTVFLANVVAPVLVVGGLAGASAVAVRSTSSESCWVAYATGANATLSMALHNPTTLVQATAPFVLSGAYTGLTSSLLELGIERMGATSALVSFSLGQWGSGWVVTSNTSPIASFGGAAPVDPWKSWTWLSKPFKAPNGSIYILGLFDVKYQMTQCLVELEQNTAFLGAPAVPVAVLAPRSSVANIDADNLDGLRRTRSRNPTVIGVPAVSKFWMNCFAVGPTGDTTINTATFDFAHPGLCQLVPFGRSSCVSGGMATTYDGLRPIEAGFVGVCPPTTVSTSNAGGAMGKFIYNYVITYRKPNARGEYLRSPPTTFSPLAIDFTGSATSTNQATLRIPHVIATLAQDDNTGTNTPNPIIIEVWRTSVISGAVTPQYYLLATIMNNMGLLSVNFVDTTDDPALQQRQVLYTTGNVLEWDCPSSLRGLVSHNNRLWGIGDDGKTIWYTAPSTDGELPRWNDYLRLYVADGGDLVSLASLDGKLFVFARDRVFTVVGDGPSDTGAGVDLSSPQLLPFGLGCTDPRALCVGPFGILTNTEKGAYVLGRGGDTSWLGERFQRTLIDNVWAAASTFLHCEVDGWVLMAFRVADATGAQGGIVHWDYRHDRISVWFPKTPSFGGLSAGAQVLTDVNGTVYLLANSGGGSSSISFYDRSTWLDDVSNWIDFRAWTGWVTPGQDYGFMSVPHAMIQCEQRSPQHGLTVSVERDYGAAIDVAATFTPAQVAGMATEVVDILFPNHRSASVALRIEDAAPSPLSGTGRGFELSGITLEITPLPGRFKLLPAAQKGG